MDAREMVCAVVDIVGNETTNFKAIAIELAKSGPEKFLYCFRRTSPIMGVARQVALKFIRSNFLAAIKEVRAATGWPLKEAKDFCDDLKAELKIV